MKIPQLLSEQNHRPWSLPQSQWKFYQEWNDALFLHYRVDPKSLRKQVPATLHIDTIEESAWVSVVAFTMNRIRPRGLPAFRPLSHFHEINVRTYVKYGNKAGVYFLSIEASKPWACKMARGISKLPYRFSTIQRSQNRFTSQNAEYGDQLQIHFQKSEPLPYKTTLDQWLTERYALFQNTETAINQFEIHHVQWPLAQVEITDLSLHYHRFSHLLSDSPALFHYSPGVQVVAWGKQSHLI